jgi:predicted DNA-binding transcriptional regulator AlpA
VPVARPGPDLGRAFDPPPSVRVVLRSCAVDIAGIAEYLGVTRQRVYQLAPEPDFPTPVDETPSREWDPAEIEAWAERAWWGTKPWRGRPSPHRP